MFQKTWWNKVLKALMKISYIKNMFNNWNRHVDGIFEFEPHKYLTVTHLEERPSETI